MTILSGTDSKSLFVLKRIVALKFELTTDNSHASELSCKTLQGFLTKESNLYVREWFVTHLRVYRLTVTLIISVCTSPRFHKEERRNMHPWSIEPV